MNNLRMGSPTKRWRVGFLWAAILMASASLATAEPALQLDIVDGTYVGSGAESTFTSSDVFQLAALLNPETGNAPPSDDAYFIAISLVPKTTVSANLGSFVFNGTTVDVTADMTAGTPAGLPPHGQFANFYSEFSFTFDLSDAGKATLYNVQDASNPHVGPVQNDDGAMFFKLFTVDITNLSGDVELHFDLYHKGADGDVDVKAPFSHDAETIPEPTAYVMAGLGLLLFTVLRRHTG